MLRYLSPSLWCVVIMARVAGLALAPTAALAHQLPGAPMRGRLADPRISYLRVEAPDPAGLGADATYIQRWRLEKREPAAAVSDVVQPVVFRIADDFPAAFVPAVTHAVEAWNPVFEAIGFRRALVVQRPGDAARDEAGRTVTIAWRDGQGATGGIAYTDPDPQSGEIRSATITIFRAGLDNAERLYFAWAGANAGIPQWPLPDSTTRTLLVHLVRHEVGHALGLSHNFGDDAYPTDSLRRASFVGRMGFTATTMGYDLINYVPQADDGITSDALLLPRIGPYDRWAIAWGYRPIPEAATPADELPTLEQWRRAQDTAAYLRSSLDSVADDPYEHDDVIGDDLLASVAYGLRNVVRQTDRVRADSARTARRALVGGWGKLLLRVVDVLGGVRPRAPYPRELSTADLAPIDAAYQVRALQFLLAHLIYGQDDFVRRVVARPPPDSTAVVLFEALRPEWEASQETWNSSLQTFQQTTLQTLLDRERLTRFAAQVSPRQPALPPAACAELTTLQRRLVAAASDPSVPARQAQADALVAIVAPIVAAGSEGLCR